MYLHGATYVLHRDDYKETVVVVMALLESLRVDTIKHVTFQLYVQGMPTSVLFKFLLNLNEMIYTCVVIITYIDLFTASFCLSIIHTYIV